MVAHGDSGRGFWKITTTPNNYKTFLWFLNFDQIGTSKNKPYSTSFQSTDLSMPMKFKKMYLLFCLFDTYIYKHIVKAVFDLAPHV